MMKTWYIPRNQILLALLACIFRETQFRRDLPVPARSISNTAAFDLIISPSKKRQFIPTHISPSQAIVNYNIAIVILIGTLIYYVAPLFSANWVRQINLRCRADSKVLSIFRNAKKLPVFFKYRFSSGNWTISILRRTV